MICGCEVREIDTQNDMLLLQVSKAAGGYYVRPGGEELENTCSPRTYVFYKYATALIVVSTMKLLVARCRRHWRGEFICDMHPYILFVLFVKGNNHVPHPIHV